MTLPFRILGTGSALPPRRVDTEAVARAAMPHRTPQWVLDRTGIRHRHWVDGQTHTDLAVQAVQAALDDAGLEAAALQRLFFVGSIGGDWRGPATANAVAVRLGLRNQAGCVDLNNACVGYVSALDLAARLAATGVAPTAIVASEVMSPWIHPDVPRPYVVLGDAAGAAIIGAAEGEGGLLAAEFANDGALLEAVMLRHCDLDGAQTPITFGLSARQIAAAATRDLAASAHHVLAEAGVTLDAVRWVLFHQPNGPMLQAFCDTLGIDRERTVWLVDEIGSVGAAAIAVGLDHLWRHRPVKTGDLVLIVGVGAGSSRGSVLFRVER